VGLCFPGVHQAVFSLVAYAVLSFIIAISSPAQSPAVYWVQIDIDASAKDADHMIGVHLHNYGWTKQ
jgi:hypothetical protein